MCKFTRDAFNISEHVSTQYWGFVAKKEKEARGFSHNPRDGPLSHTCSPKFIHIMLHINKHLGVIRGLGF